MYLEVLIVTIVLGMSIQILATGASSHGLWYNIERFSGDQE